MTLAFPKPLPREKRRKPLRANPRSEQKRAGTERDDSPYRRFVVRLGYCMAADLPNATPCSGPIQPAHMALGPDEKGTALKTHDRQCVPMCQTHHRHWDNERTSKSMFFGWTKPERYDQARKWVEAIQLEATPPTDDKGRAFDLQELGLGRVVDGSDGCWHWEPGPFGEEEHAA